MDEQEKDTLYIPLGLKLNPEIFDGFVKEELFKSAITTIVAGLLDIVFYLVTKNIAVSIVMILASIAGSVMAFTKDKTNLSVADQICNMVRFSKMQKQYSYKYLDEWIEYPIKRFFIVALAYFVLLPNYDIMILRFINPSQNKKHLAVYNGRCFKLKLKYIGLINALLYQAAAALCLPWEF